jgi:translation initiation factor IF-3
MSRFPFRPYPSREPAHRRNGKIRAREVRVLDEAKQPVGVMPLNEALRLAQSKGLDLVEIAPTAVPPVCRIVEYGKFQYEESKKKKDSQSRQPANQMKELQFTANIDPHDLRIKMQHAIEFLCEGLKVRVRLRFRGRQKAHKEFGQDIVNQLLAGTAPYGRPDAPPQMFGDRDLNVTISPLPRELRGKPPREIKAPTPSAQTPDVPPDIPPDLPPAP